jgi:hypothetical protein
MRLKTYVILLFIAFAMNVKSFAQIDYSRLAPDFTQLQYAGGKGWLSGYAGWHLLENRKLDLALGYGFAPEWAAGVEIHNLLLQLQYNFAGFGLEDNFFLKPFLTLGSSLQLKDNGLLFLSLPDFMPKGYYAPNALRAHLDVGFEILKSNIGRHEMALGLYALATTNDVYLNNFFIADEVGLRDIFSLALGMRVYF